MEILDGHPKFWYNGRVNRYLKKPVLEDLKEKMVFISGPRQVGKTTLALSLAPKSHYYLNWDIAADREFILREKFPTSNFVIFDEVHKFKNWRNYIKGFYDKHRTKKRILVTGSAHLDYYRHSGDSLAGRYHHYRLHPFTVGELKVKSQQDMQDLLALGGFPEPFLSGSQRKALRWRREYRTRIIHEDIPSLELAQNLSAMEHVLLSLPNRVGSPLSISALSEDFGVSYKTIDKYLNILERMYLIYRVASFRAKKLRSLKKAQKHYLYNWAEVLEAGPRFENLVAGHLLKWVHFMQDYNGADMELCYFRDSDHREVDFVVVQNQKPILAIECKLRSKTIAAGLKYFKTKFPKARCVQLHLEPLQEYESPSGIESLHWSSLLPKLPKLKD